MSKLVELFCDVDDFCKVFIPQKDWGSKKIGVRVALLIRLLIN
jgi:hypothetical protein